MIPSGSAAGCFFDLGAQHQRDILRTFNPIRREDIFNRVSDFGILGETSGEKPSESAIFGLGSPSMASTSYPRAAKIRASVAEVVVLPTPPLPETAIFIMRSLY
jgi:hypothetical protein